MAPVNPSRPSPPPGPAAPADPELAPLAPSESIAFASTEAVLPKLTPQGIVFARDFSLPRAMFLAALVFCGLAALGWSLADAHDEAVGEETRTILNVNTFEVSDLGLVRSKLASRTDSTLYEFLSVHHDTALLRGSESNVVTEVLKALEHESAQVGVPLMIELFSDVFKAWPLVVLPAVDRKKISEMRDKIFAYTVKLQPDTKPDAYDQDGQSLIEATRLMIIAIRDSGAQIDNMQLGLVLAETDLFRLGAFLKNTLFADEARPYLERIDIVREKDLADVTDPKKKAVPSDKALTKCTDALKELELYVADKPQLSLMIRDLLLKDLKKG